uniref:Uncharacterized protein n=1 Tax=Oryza punctata TaxID=4537 RepID=A0A0E0MAF4_ORYPU
MRVFLTTSSFTSAGDDCQRSKSRVGDVAIMPRIRCTFASHARSFSQGVSLQPPLTQQQLAISSSAICAVLWKRMTMDV